jgi:hypothetical protein
MTDTVEVYALAGFSTKRSVRASAYAYAMIVTDLPHGGWVGQGCHREEVQRLTVPKGSPEHVIAEATSSRRRMEEGMAESALTFSDVAHDNGGMVALYDLLEGQTALWASGMPASTPRSEARRFMLACVDALATRMRQCVEGVIADDIALPWGDDDGGVA